MNKEYYRKIAAFVEFYTNFAKLNIFLFIMIECIKRRLIIMENEKKLSNKMKRGIKKGLFVALKSNANSSGCYVIYQPKVPKSLDKFKKFK